ncbi:MAG: LptA/OstA family protein [Bacillota bacterium]
MKRIKYGLILIIIILIYGSNLVLGASVTGGELSGDRITFYFAESEKGEVIIVEENVILNYREMKAEADFGRHEVESGFILLRDNIRMEQEDHTLTAGRMEGNLEEEELHFSGGVEAKSGERIISGEQLDYNHEQGEMIFPDRTRVSYNNIEAEADRVEYYPAEDRILLSGNVEGSQNGREFSAAEIELREDRMVMREGSRIRFTDGGEE